MARLAVLVIGHPDYPQRRGLAAAEGMSEWLRGHGAEVEVVPEPAVSHEQAAKAARELVGGLYDGVVYLMASWLECPTAVAAVRELEHLPFALWGFGQYEEEGRLTSSGSMVGLVVLKATLERMGYRFAWALGDEEDPAARATLLDFSRVAGAMARLKRTRIGLVGYASMGMYPGTMDHVLTRRWVGPETVHLDTFTLVNRMEAAGEADAARFASRLGELVDVAPECPPDDIETARRMYAALRELADEHQLDAVNVKCQYELSKELGCTACLALSVLADDGVVCACEGDMPLAVSMCLLDALSGTPVAYGDLLDVSGDELLLSSCGFFPPALAAGRPRVVPHRHEGFAGPLVSAVGQPGPVTLLRLFETRGGFGIHYAHATGLPSEPRMGCFPALSVRLDGAADAFLAHAKSQHYAFCYGHWGSAVALYAELAGFELVAD